eukprot:365473-Chlamydomonas_euryale.AAC.7
MAVTVLPASSSAGHKFKLVGVTVSEVGNPERAAHMSSLPTVPHELFNRTCAAVGEPTSAFAQQLVPLQASPHRHLRNRNVPLQASPHRHLRNSLCRCRRAHGGICATACAAVGEPTLAFAQQECADAGKPTPEFAQQESAAIGEPTPAFAHSLCRCRQAHTGICATA